MTKSAKDILISAGVTDLSKLPDPTLPTRDENLNLTRMIIPIIGDYNSPPYLHAWYDLLYYTPDEDAVWRAAGLVNLQRQINDAQESDTYLRKVEKKLGLIKQDGLDENNRIIPAERYIFSHDATSSSYKHFHMNVPYHLYGMAANYSYITANHFCYAESYDATKKDYVDLGTEMTAVFKARYLADNDLDNLFKRHDIDRLRISEFAIKAEQKRGEQLGL